MGEPDLQRLREHDFTDEQIHIAAQVVSYFNYINRIADGLGVDLEDWMTLDPAEWRQRKGRDWLAAPPKTSA